MKSLKQLSVPPTDTNECGGLGSALGSDEVNARMEEMTMISCFAVFPDGSASPTAVFADLEDAMDWGLERYGGDAFGIRYLEMAQVESAERRGAPGPA